ncbi:hypothetical protein [Methanococcoides methylutens]|uniref:Uncharacterized protein n=1 Tax=Methanococcoides methylutens MM1 TaxID=1434104 RepID=A0A0E3SSA0_METMT|nr:hypothetical protein [Methanococcoides methylutens]AKB85227.1 hypothetical protein MCMEM_1174 [Methanococcoides methylutens MM1]
MTKKILKLLSCLAVILMVACILPSGAFAAENGQLDKGDVKFGKMNRFADSGMDRSDVREKFQDKMPEFESDEEKFDFFQDKMSELIGEQIERLESIDLDEIDNEHITAELIEERLEALNSAKTELETAESLEDLGEIRESIAPVKPHDGHGDRNMGMMEEMPEFESDEEKFEYLLEMMSESIDKRIEALESIDLDEIDNERITAENIAERLDNLEQAQEALADATSLDDLKEIREDLKEMRRPHPPMELQEDE